MESSNGSQALVTNLGISVAFTHDSDLLTLSFGGMNKLHLSSEKGQLIKYMKGKCLRKPKHLSVARDGRL